MQMHEEEGADADGAERDGAEQEEGAAESNYRHKTHLLSRA